MAERPGEAMPPRVRLLCLGAAMACLLPLLLQVDGGLALGLLVIAALGISVSRPWPLVLRLLMLGLLMSYVLVSHGFTLGRDTGCAVLAALLALKPFETHKLRDARSLLGFSLFAPFTAFLQDQGPVTLLLSLPAIALLLAALAVLAEQRPGAPMPRIDLRRLRTIALALAMALPLALAGFWLFPRLATPLWGLPENALGRGGLSDQMTPDQWVELFADDRPALRVVFDGAEPDRGERYWRGQVLWDFDGKSWNRGDRAAGAPPPARVADPVKTLSYRVSLEPTDRRYLVTLDLPLEDPSQGRLASDYTTYVNQPVTELLHYTARSTINAPYRDAMDPAELRAALSLPTGLNPRTRALSEQWRREAAGDDDAVVRRALAWIGQEFSYSLTVPPSGRNAVDDFLFETQVGFCQHFSSAFANLMRGAGIPTRVVIGYSGGYRNPYGNYWIVRRMDAHAWNEVWIEGRGWIRVDPTAAVAPERVLDTINDRARQESLLPDALTPLRDIGDWARRSWNDLVLGFNAARQASLLRPLGIDRASSGQLVAAFAIGAGIALALTLWFLLRGSPMPRDPVDAAWRRFTRRLARAGLVKRVSEPPLSFGERLAMALPGQAEQLLSLSRRYARWRYAAGQLSPAEKASLTTDLRGFRPITHARQPGASP